MNRGTRTFIWGFVLAGLGWIWIEDKTAQLEQDGFLSGWNWFLLVLDVIILISGVNKISKSTN